MLAGIMALSDCGSMRAAAVENMPAENAVPVETSISDNSEEVVWTEDGDAPISDEVTTDDTGISENGIEEGGNRDDADAAQELPALQIGQIPAGEELPAPDDSGFEYDLPVSFAASDSLLLFVNYDINAVSGQEESGQLVWSILRGEKGLAAGSTGLIMQEDDWIGFETVSAAPCFTLTESAEENGADESNGYCRAELVSKEAKTQAEPEEAYDYYIRAAYYTGAEDDGAFYTAATVPFVPLTQETDVIPDDTTDNADQAQDDVSAGKDTDDDGMSDGIREEESAAEDGDTEVVTEDESLETGETAEETTSLSENDMAEETASLSENNIQPGAEGHITGLILSETSVFMQPGSMKKITARTEPENVPDEITWESSNESVAVVNEDGEITAKAEGIAWITAECDECTAAARVEVVRSDDGEKLLDLSGDIWVAGFKRESEDFIYSGQKITQDIRVYYKETLLREKTDYTLSYKNNVNAAAWNSAKAPAVTINLKGQYQGSVTLHYTIKPLDINSIDSYHTGQNDSNGDNDAGSRSPGYEQTVPYSLKMKIPNPVLTFGKKKLTAGKDYVCDYTILQEELEKEPQDGQQADYNNGNCYRAGKVYHYTVNGTGNYTGSFNMQFVVLDDKNHNFSSAAVTFGQKQYEYQGRPLTEADVTIEQIKLNGQILDKKLYDYDVCANGIEGAYVTVYPSEDGREDGYRGCKKVNLKLIGDRNIGEAVPGANWKDIIPFSQKTVDKNGGIFQANTGLLTFGSGSEPLMEGVDYAVKYSNAAKAGKVTVTFTGKGRYKGTLKKKYEITPNFDKTNITIVWGQNVKTLDGMLAVAYQKGGASPDFVLRDQNRCVLKIKTDYTVKLKDNKTPGEPMSLEITGKGNYKGYAETVQLQVTTGDIGLATISIPDKPYSTKTNAWQSAVTIKDVNGKKLAAGTDYDKQQITYSYEDMESGQPPKAGTTVTVKVNGIGCYENSITGQYRIFENKISKLKFVIDQQEYTGQEITLTPTVNIHAYANSSDAKKKQNEIMEACYKVTGYQNNIKAGTAKVTLQGIGDYGGTKTYSFKIQKKTYRINRVMSIQLDKSSLSLSLAEKVEEKRTITAKIKAQTEGKISNPTVIWSVSDSRVATVEDRIIDDTTVAAVITLKKEGNVTITATTQDGNKQAQCKVKIVDAPLLKQAGQEIRGEAGETHQLELEKSELQKINLDDIVWESNNPDVVSVTKEGLFGKLTMKKTGAAVIKVKYHGYVQQCYALVVTEETLPEGKCLTYEREPGCTDDTPYINRLLRNWEWSPGQYDYMYLPAGVYWIDPAEGGKDQFGSYKFGGIILTDNQKLIMSPSALLMTIANGKDGYHVIWAFGRDNITISGGQIIGERREHKGTGGEWGHGIQISGCTNVTIEDVEISHCWGDGIYLGYYAEQKKFSKDVTITNCNLHHNRRNNLSLTDVSNVTIDHCKFNNANGTDPQYGIDIEPNENKACENVTIRNSEFKGNAKASMGIIKAANNIRLENCTLDGNFYNMAGQNVVLKNTSIGGETVDATGGIRRE